MEKSLIIRYSEIHLKGKNIKFFENMLLKNLKNSLSSINCKVTRTRGRYIVEDYDINEEFELIERIKKVFGVHSVSSAYIIPAEFETIKETVLKMIDFNGTFKVVTNRALKTFPMDSMAISRELGSAILEAYPTLTVNVREPEHVINVDVRENGKAYIFEKIIYCAGGLPTGCSGRAVTLLSGGIDSPVASYLMAKRGLDLEAVYFHSYPYTGDLAKEKVITLAKRIACYTGKLSLNIVSLTEIQETIHDKCSEEFMITLMRRFMMKIAERIANNTHAQAIITGESLGQVASQTIESINVTNEVVSMPVFRPLIGFDKLEIIKIAKEIGTFDTSILPYEDCCTVFLPAHPVIKPKKEIVYKEELNLDIESLIEQAMSSIETIKI